MLNGGGDCGMKIWISCCTEPLVKKLCYQNYFIGIILIA